MLIRYCAATDKYYRGTGDKVSNHDSVLDGWESGVEHASEIFRKVENDWKMVSKLLKTNSLGCFSFV